MTAELPWRQVIDRSLCNSLVCDRVKAIDVIIWDRGANYLACRELCAPFPWSGSICQFDSDGNIIVADRGNKVIKIFSPSGQFLRKIGEEGSLTYPFHCVQYDNFLIVSDSDENSIKVFSREGDFLYKFGKKGEGDGELNTPRCLSFNKAGHLMVCDAGNHRVQVFELNGKFMRKFGTKGSGIGQLNRPVSTAVLSDGKIVVSDFNNDRIQIFE